ncbi:hypothetical protein C8R30_12223 [Nitrosomonas nitrosa]|uniref:Uncharacterized protein n=1 Tax=Nitrosomonas nitrosa TaxID=52442 RepID=A0A1I4TM92_9PROT|nr:hypothetical protein [Nitrosomonas nitrosa]PTQ92600.1 hypothetical protein C8R30_12223 [Nitrosomonas nitrosa]SFM77878.1 hypothetical protein SAMN05421880_13312 [Nitrosomonas nitrosa]
MHLQLGFLAFLFASNLFAWSTETSDDIWRSGWGQGVSEAEVTRGSGNKIYVACLSGREWPLDMGSSISFMLAGDGPKPNSELLIIFDKKHPESFSVDKHGKITSDCRACAANFDYLIEQLKKHSSIYVRFSDGRESTFTLKGSAKAIGECPSAWSQ